MTTAQQLILVDETDKAIGTMDKMEAHRKGLLHRAFSVFIFNEHGDMLLQRRAGDKYHSPGLWTNACCSHPYPGEDVGDGALRRLEEELGFTTPLEELFSFVYRWEFDNGLTEHEYDHVFAGVYNGRITVNPAEVMDHEYRSMEEIRTQMDATPELFTPWFRIALPRMSGEVNPPAVGSNAMSLLPPFSKGE